MISGRFGCKMAALEPLFCGANRSGVSSITGSTDRKNAVSGNAFRDALQEYGGRSPLCWVQGCNALRWVQGEVPCAG